MVQEGGGAGRRRRPFNLGVMYEIGEGVPQDHAVAASWYRKAAEQGNAGAQHNLGRMYAQGRGVPQDYAVAVKWYRMAAEQGHAEAKEALRKVGTKGKRRPRQAAPSHAPRSQEEWRQLGKADFPAYVKTIVFPNGNVLDANHSVTWDPWTARFGGQRAKAYRRGPHPDFGFTRIDILLTCKSKIGGGAVEYRRTTPWR